ncbi:hypothetical protein LX36DRAFT_657626 [Colletotrichum falcatum]|nr:hypothetical protein LX36DRAFT_657626 [Colletotrichum falcatum]
MKMQVAVVLSAFLAAVAAAPADPTNPDDGCWPLGRGCLFGTSCCSGKCDLAPGQTAGNPVCVTEYTTPPNV